MKCFRLFHLKWFTKLLDLASYNSESLVRIYWKSITRKLLPISALISDHRGTEVSSLDVIVRSYQ